MTYSHQRTTPLSFPVPTAQLDDFSEIHERQLKTLLKERGPEHSLPLDPPPVPGVFSLVERAGDGSLFLGEIGS